MSALETKSVENASNSTTTYHFEQRTTIPTYLIAIASGNLAGREIGPRSTVWCEPEVVDKAAWEFEVTYVARVVLQSMLKIMTRTPKALSRLAKTSSLPTSGVAMISWCCRPASPTAVWR